jgi:hypothetical protein
MYLVFVVPVLLGGSDPLVGDSSHAVVNPLSPVRQQRSGLVSQFLSTRCVMVLAVVSFQSRPQDSLKASRCLQRVYAESVFLAAP